MAHNATFTANFSSWNKAVADAQKNIKVFARDVDVSSKGTQAALQRMTSSFDGSKILKDANLAAAAIDKIGGAAKLTENEQKRVNATVTEALAKYKALGEQAPAALQKLARETDSAGKSAHGLSGFVQTALGTFAGFASAQAVIGGVKAAISGVGSVISSAFATNASLEKTTLQFTTLMGDADKAKTHVKSLFDFAKATPFETGPIIEASRSLQVFGGSALNTKANLTLIGDAAAATGAPINELSTWVGKMYANLAAGRPIGEAAARLGELGVIGPQARAALEQVAAGGGNIETKFKAVQQTLGQFTGAMQAQANTWDGITSSLADVVNLTVADAFKGLYETARDAMGNVVKILGDEGVTGALGNVGKSILNAFGGDQKTQVAGMTRLFVGLAQAAISTAEIMVRAAGTVGAAWFGAVSAIAVERSRLNNAFASIPLIGDRWKDNAKFAEDEAKWRVEYFEASKRAALGNNEFVKSLGPLREELKRAGDDAVKMAGATTATGAAAKGATPPTKTLGDTFGNLGGTVKGALTAYDKWVASLTPGVVATNNQVNALNAMAKAYDLVADAEARGKQFGKLIDGRSAFLGNQISLGGNVATDRMAQIGGLATGVSLGGFVGASNQNTIGRPVAGVNWGGILSQLPQQLASVFSSGGSAGQIGGGLGSLGGGIAGTAIAGALGATAGSVLGSAVPVIGTLIGGFLGKKLGSLFGPSKNAIADKAATANISASQAKLIAQFGSVDKIAGMNTAGADLAAGWGHQGRAGEAAFNAQTEAFLAMVEKQNGLLTEQDTLQVKLLTTEQRRAELAASLVATWDQVSAAIDRYGTTAAALGPQIAQMGTTAGFTDLLEDIDLFTRAGATAGGVLNAMKEEISKAVTEAMKLGTEVPENMRPWIEELSRTGRLLDANGTQIKDLTSIKWGAAAVTEAEKTRTEIAKLDETFATVTEALDRIVTQLSELLPRAAADGARRAQNAFDANRPTLTVDVDYNDPGFSPDGRENGPQGFASGSGGLRNFGRGTRAILHGREAVLTEGQYTSLQAAARGRARSVGAGGVTNHINIVVDRPSVRSASDIRDLARAVEQQLVNSASLARRRTA